MSGTHDPAATSHVESSDRPLEPRVHPRGNVAVQVRLTCADGRALDGSTSNLSEGGALVRLSEACTTGGEVTIEFDASTPLRVVARVVRASELDEHGRAEVAVEFVALSEELAAALGAIAGAEREIAWDTPTEPCSMPREVAARFVPILRRMARSLGQRLPSHAAIDDLIGSGFLALVELYPKHAALPIEQLEKVLSPRVRWAMLESLRQGDPLKRRGRNTLRRIDEATRTLRARFDRTPTREEIASELGMSVDSVEEVLQSARGTTTQGTTDVTELDLADENAAEPETAAATGEELQGLRRALDALPARHRQVLELYYGDELKLRQIGNLLGVTEARISQLVQDAIGRLRKHDALAR